DGVGNVLPAGVRDADVGMLPVCVREECPGQRSRIFGLDARAAEAVDATHQLAAASSERTGQLRLGFRWHGGRVAVRRLAGQSPESVLEHGGASLTEVTPANETGLPMRTQTAPGVGWRCPFGMMARRPYMY